MPTKRFENINPERKKKILDAAKLEFIRNGYDGASLNNIVREAEISKGSLYYYFEDKIDIYLTILRHEMEQTFKKIGGIVTDEFTDDFWGDIKKYLKNAMQFISKNPDSLRLAQELSHLSSTLYSNESFKEMYNLGLVKTVEILKRGRDMGEVRTDIPIELLATIIYKLGETLDYWMLEQWGEFTPEEIEKNAEIYLDLFKRIAGTETAKGVAV